MILTKYLETWRMTNRFSEVVVGPPGTGKTTDLLKLVGHYLHEGVPPERIAYIAFTRKAAHEAIGRAIRSFGGSHADYPFFRTIHSLCFKQLGISRQQVVRHNHLSDLGNRLGLEIRGNFRVDDGYFTAASTVGDKVVFLESLSRSTQKSLRRVWEQSNNIQVEYAELERFHRAYHVYKTNYGLVDFTDMLERYQSVGPVPDLDVLIVDEAQDLSRLQWLIVKRLMTKAKRVHIAGDDDQAIYTWAGADVRTFIDLPFKQRTLTRSWRVPAEIKRIADEIRSRIQVKRPKDYQAFKSGGSVEWVFSPEEIDMSSGEWLLMARNQYMLKAYEDICITEGFPYENHNGYSPLNSEVFTAIKAWTTYSKTGEMDDEGRRAVRRYSSSDRIPNQPHCIWHEALDRIPPATREFFIAALRRGERLLRTPRIKISTIHGAKGGEAENVVVATDLAPQTYEGFTIDPDPEYRVFYVAATRAKQRLIFIQPMTQMHMDI
jgi:DNA helicase-2/ATP-dependent DNA helicase PcrA